MDRITVLDIAMHAAGIPIEGLSGSGLGCRIDFLPSATAEQRRTAAAMLAAFSWALPPAVRSAVSLEALYMSTTKEDRTPVWDALAEWAMAKLISREIQNDPNAAQAVLDKLKADKKLKFDLQIFETRT